MFRTHRSRRFAPLTGAAFAFLCATAPQTAARTIYVNRSAPGAVQDGTSWSAAYLTLQAGVTAATAADEVWVAKGTYPEYVTLKDGSAMYGGFAGAETSRDQRNWRANPTVLEGAGTNDANIVSSTFTGVVVDGFTIRNGTSGFSGVSITGGSAAVRHCVVTGNSTGLTADVGTANVIDCSFSANDAGVYVSSRGTANVVNCTFSANAYGIYQRSGTLSVANSILAYNGKGIYHYLAADTINLSHNNVFGSATDNYRNVADPTGYFGNISQDPLFADATNGDFHLLSGSPCIDAGDDKVVPAGDADLDAKPRIGGAHVDMGALEYGAAPFSLDDVAKALKLSAGLAASSDADVTLLNVEPGTPGLDLADAVRLARKAAGLEANP